MKQAVLFVQWLDTTFKSNANKGRSIHISSSTTKHKIHGPHALGQVIWREYYRSVLVQVRIRISSSTVNLQVYGPHAVDKIIWHRRAQLIPAFNCFIRSCACSCLVSTGSKLWRWQHLFCHQEWWIARVWSECCAVRFQFRLFNNLCLKFYTEKRTCSDFAWGMHKIKLASVWKHTAEKNKTKACAS